MSALQIKRLVPVDILLHHFPVNRRSFSVEKCIASPSPSPVGELQLNLDPKKVTSVLVDACIHKPGTSWSFAINQYYCNVIS